MVLGVELKVRAAAPGGLSHEVTSEYKLLYMVKYTAPSPASPKAKYALATVMTPLPAGAGLYSCPQSESSIEADTQFLDRLSISNCM